MFSVLISSMCFNLLHSPLPSVIFPAQIEEIVGAKDKEKYNGFVPAFGIFKHSYPMVTCADSCFRSSGVTLNNSHSRYYKNIL